jgi:hypothetical protein
LGSIWRVNDAYNWSVPFGRYGITTHLENAVLAALLLLEDLKRLGLKSGSDDTVRDFAGDDFGGRRVDGVGEGDEVAKRGHTVGT